MGQDWGGPIGMTVALERADRVGGMVCDSYGAGRLQDLSGRTAHA
jgi:pimeloyl-ACP methyl ester carboxylesterase